MKKFGTYISQVVYYLCSRFKREKTMNEENIIIGELCFEPCVFEIPRFSYVKAGKPVAPGDYDGDMMMVPRELAKDITYSVEVHGESMRDFDLREGDVLLVRMQNVADSGDIVIGSINGECTVKTYYEDEDGDKWLVPGNDSFEPIFMDSADECRIIALVQQIIHKAPRIKSNECARRIKGKKIRKKQERAVYAPELIAKALDNALRTITERGMSESRSWFSVYRVFADKGVIQEGDYTSFMEHISGHFGENAPNINIKDIRANVDVLSFHNPVALWNVKNAPVTGKRFIDYLELARVTSDTLKGKQ